jgi:hypothetical protein
MMRARRYPRPVRLFVVPQTITSPLGHKLSLKFHDELDAVPDKDAKPCIDRSRWQTAFRRERVLAGDEGSGQGPQGVGGGRRAVDDVSWTTCRGRRVVDDVSMPWKMECDYVRVYQLTVSEKRISAQEPQGRRPRILSSDSV